MRTFWEEKGVFWEGGDGGLAGAEEELQAGPHGRDSHRARCIHHKKGGNVMEGFELN